MDTNNSVMGYKGISLYPTPHQKRLLTRTFGCVRFVYNQYTTYKDWEYRHGYSKSKDTRKTHSELRSLLTVHNKEHQYPWLKEVSSVALQSACDDAKNNYAVMVANRSDGKKASLPRRRKYGNQSFRLSGKGNVKIRETDKKRHRGHIHIPHVGWVRYHAGKDITQASSVTIMMDKYGRYTASVNLPVEEKHCLPGAAKACGIDVGLIDLIVMGNTNGDRVSLRAPQFYRKQERKIAQKSKATSRKVKGSSGRRKANKSLAKAHRKAQNQRHDLLHKCSTFIADNNHAVVMETLDVAGMAKNTRLSKSIYDASWSTLVEMLQYKTTQREGSTFTQVNRYEPTTQVCSICGRRGGKKALSVRVWECEHCHTTLDRDANAAINIIDAGGHSESLNAGGASVRRLLSQPLDAVKSEYFPKDTTQVIGDNLSPLLQWYKLRKPLHA